MPHKDQLDSRPPLGSQARSLDRQQWHLENSLLSIKRYTAFHSPRAKWITLGGYRRVEEV